MCKYGFVHSSILYICACVSVYASMAEWLWAWDTLATMKLMEAGGREFDPRPGHYSRMSF